MYFTIILPQFRITALNLLTDVIILINIILIIMKITIVNAAAVRAKLPLNIPELITILIILPEIRLLLIKTIIVTAICNTRYKTIANLAKILNV